MGSVSSENTAKTDSLPWPASAPNSSTYINRCVDYDSEKFSQVSELANETTKAQNYIICDIP